MKGKHERIYQSALGIQTGDIVTTNRHGGPYEVWSISGPYITSLFPGTLVIYPVPVISLGLVTLRTG
jgi:hypothetical protein